MLALKSQAGSRSSQSQNRLWLYELTMLFQLVCMLIQLRDLVLGRSMKFSHCGGNTRIPGNADDGGHERNAEIKVVLAFL